MSDTALPAVPAEPAKRSLRLPLIIGGAALAVAVILTVILTSAFGGGSGPERAVQDMLTSIETQDCALLEEVTTQSMRETLGSGEECMLDVPIEIQHTFVVTDTTITGSTATVEGILESSYDGSEANPGRVSFTLVQENGAWKVDATS